MAPRADAVASTLRRQGALIIHAPGDCMDFYRGTPARLRATSASQHAAPVPFHWNPWNGEREGQLPPTLGDPGPCSCDTPEPCGDGRPPYPWTRQVAAIEIAPEDAVTDSGQEVYNLLEDRGLEDVLVMGVHTNICVLAREYGIRQLVYLGKRPRLCRDLTDSFHRDPRGHAWGTEQIVAHIERHWCPTVTSDQLVGGSPFAFPFDSVRPLDRLGRLVRHVLRIQKPLYLEAAYVVNPRCASMFVPGRLFMYRAFNSYFRVIGTRFNSWLLATMVGALTACAHSAGRGATFSPRPGGAVPMTPLDSIIGDAPFDQAAGLVGLPLLRTVVLPPSAKEVWIADWYGMIAGTPVPLLRLRVDGDLATGSLVQMYAKTEHAKGARTDRCTTRPGAQGVAWCARIVQRAPGLDWRAIARTLDSLGVWSLRESCITDGLYQTDSGSLMLQRLQGAEFSTYVCNTPSRRSGPVGDRARAIYSRFHEWTDRFVGKPPA